MTRYNTFWHIGALFMSILLVPVLEACNHIEAMPPPLPWADQCGDTDEKADLSRCSLDTALEDTDGVCAAQVCVPLRCDGPECVAQVPPAALPDTNQKSCYDSTQPMDICPASDAAAYYGQDAQYGPDVAGTSDARFSRDTSYDEEPIVEDTVTGKLWQGCAAGAKGIDCDADDNLASDKYFRRDAETYCETLNWGGYDAGWSLPDKDTLESIVDLGIAQNPVIDGSKFLNTPLEKFWSSSASDIPGNSFFVNFETGGISFDDETEAFAVRCVRDGSGPPADAGDSPGMIWQVCTDEKAEPRCAKVSWKDALAYCEMLTWGGAEDWRLPNRRELLSIVDENFQNTPTDDFWSSSSVAANAGCAWSVSFFDGKSLLHRKAQVAFVRCVR